MKAAFDGTILKVDVDYETVQYWSVAIPPAVEKELQLKPRDRFIVRIPGAVFWADGFGKPGDLAFSFPPEMARTLNLRSGAKIKVELERPDLTAKAP
jgi:antitoxin component of MazEF toxin-antitoxin module